MNRVFEHLSYHLLSSISFSFIAGIAATSIIKPSFFASPLITIAPVILLAIILVAIILVFHFFSRTGIVFLLLLLLFFVIGFFHAERQSYPPGDANHIYNIIDKKRDVVVVGTLTVMPEYDRKSSKFQLAAQFMRRGSEADLVAVKGNILFRMIGQLPAGMQPGDLLLIRADLKRPTSFSSPGSFDFSQYLAKKDIWITGFIRSPVLVKKLSNRTSLFHKIRYLPEKLRNKIATEITNRVSPDVSGLYKAILIGDRSGLSDSVLEQFKASGVMHILAISGIHMSVIGAIFFGLFYRILSLSEAMLLNFNIKKSASILCLAMLICYSTITGLNAPVVRSVIMSAVVITAICIDRKKSASELLFFAAFLILSQSPLQLFTASFQLSFAAVSAIIAIIPYLKQLLANRDEEKSVSTVIRTITNWFIAGILVSIVATLATLPLSLYYFNRISFIGPIANIIVEPLICLWSLSWGIIAIPFLFFMPIIGDFCLQLGGYGLDLAIRVVELFSSFPYSDTRLPSPPVWLIFIYYITFILLIVPTRGSRRLYALYLPLFFAALALFVFPPTTIFKNHTKQFSISFLDVGQGSSTLLEFPSGYTVLIDGGGSSYLTTTVGERVIAPYLWHRGIAKIDTVVLTHADSDHSNGLPFIVNNFSPSKIILNSISGKNIYFRQLLELARERNIEIEIATNFSKDKNQNELLNYLTNVSLWPAAIMRGDSRKGQNNGLIVKACVNNFCLLFPGDINKQVESVLTEEDYPLASDILLAPHHGSATSNSKQFLQAVNPKYVIVSAGKNSKNRFPSPDLRERCNASGIRLLQTSQYGTIEIISEVISETIPNQAGYRIYGYRKKAGNPLAALEKFLITPR